MKITQRIASSFLGITLVIGSLLPVHGFSQSTNYLQNGAPNGIALLPAPPKPGSPEEAADLETVRSVFEARTDAEKSRAFKDSALSFALFAPAIGPEFDLEHLPQTRALLQQVKKEIGIVIDIPKDHFKRKRPYLLDPHLSLGDPEPSFSYPSGHSTRGTVYSMVLAELFPRKKEPILEFGRTIGWDRILIGKHFPTDVYAGRVLGQAIVKQLLSSPKFQQDLAAARAEIKQATSSPAQAAK
jgi:acid phosphatase (class A)